MDVVAGPFMYFGPDFQEARELYLPATVNIAGSEYPGGHPMPQVGAITHGNYPPSFMSWVYDFNNDGWNDVFTGHVVRATAHFLGPRLHQPEGRARHWDNYEVVPLITNEANQFVDVDGDGKPELTMQLATRFELVGCAGRLLEARLDGCDQAVDVRAGFGEGHVERSRTGDG